MIVSLPRSAIGVLALLLAVPLAAQETSPPAPPAAPAVADSPAVLLTYKFKAGQIQRFRANLNSAMTMTMSGGPAGAPAGPGAIPLEMKGTFGYTEKVLGARQGTGTLRVEPNALQFTANAMGTTMDAKLVNGKMVMTQNGQPLPQGAAAPGMMPGVQTAPTTIYRTATGEVTQKENPSAGAAAASGANSLFGGAALGAVAQFPDHPVRVGESWETTRQFPGQGLGPALPGGGAGTVDLRLTHTLKEILTKGTRRIAVIESVGSTSVGAPGAPGNAAAPAVPNAGEPDTGNTLTQNLTGVTYFDVDRGALITSRFNSDLSAKVAIPIPVPTPDGAAGAGTGAPAGLGFRIECQIGVKVAEVMGAPAPAGKKVIAPRARGRRSR